MMANQYDRQKQEMLNTWQRAMDTLDRYGVVPPNPFDSADATLGRLGRGAQSTIPPRRVPGPYAPTSSYGRGVNQFFRNLESQLAGEAVDPQKRRRALPNGLPPTLAGLMAAGQQPESAGPDNSVIVGTPFNPNSLQGGYGGVMVGQPYNPDQLGVDMMLGNRPSVNAVMPNIQGPMRRPASALMPPMSPPVDGLPQQVATDHMPANSYMTGKGMSVFDRPDDAHNFHPSDYKQSLSYQSDPSGFGDGLPVDPRTNNALRGNGDPRAMQMPSLSQMARSYAGLTNQIAGDNPAFDAMTERAKAAAKPPIPYAPNSYGQFGPNNSQNRIAGTLARMGNNEQVSAADMTEAGLRPRGGVLSPQGRNNAMAVLNAQEQAAAAAGNQRMADLYGGPAKLQGKTTMTPEQVDAWQKRMAEERQAATAERVAAQVPLQQRQRNVIANAMMGNLQAAGMSPQQAYLMAQDRVNGGGQAQTPGAPQVAQDGPQQGLAGLMANPTALHIMGFPGAAQAVQQQQYMNQQASQFNQTQATEQAKLGNERRSQATREAQVFMQQGRPDLALQVMQAAEINVPEPTDPGSLPNSIAWRPEGPDKEQAIMQHHAANGVLSPQVAAGFQRAYDEANNNLSGSWSNPETYNSALDHMVNSVLPSGTTEQKANVRKLAEAWFKSPARTPSWTKPPVARPPVSASAPIQQEYQLPPSGARMMY